MAGTQVVITLMVSHPWECVVGPHMSVCPRRPSGPFHYRKKKKTRGIQGRQRTTGGDRRDRLHQAWMLPEQMALMQIPGSKA